MGICVAPSCCEDFHLSKVLLNYVLGLMFHLRTSLSLDPKFGRKIYYQGLVTIQFFTSVIH